MSQKSPELLGLAYVSHSFYCIPCMCTMTSDSRYCIHELTNCTFEMWLSMKIAHLKVVVLYSMMPQIVTFSLEGLADVAISYWLISMVERNP